MAKANQVSNGGSLSRKAEKAVLKQRLRNLSSDLTYMTLIFMMESGCCQEHNQTALSMSRQTIILTTSPAGSLRRCFKTPIKYN